MSKSSILIGLLSGVIIGYILVFGFYSQEIRYYNRLVQDLDEIEDAYNIQSDNLELIKGNYKELQDDYNELRNEYFSLEQAKQQLQYELEDTELNWRKLSDCVKLLKDTQDSYVDLEESFKRIVNSNELDKIANTISEISKNEEYNWYGYWNIHKYIRDGVKYSYDLEIPIIEGYRYYGDHESPLITDFNISTIQNHLQNLSYTIKYEQGDCEDQALLEYAMIQYYNEYLQGTKYSLYLAKISFTNGEHHLAVFMPVEEGNICILDPAGLYQTGTWYSIQSKKADLELTRYQEHWDDAFGEIYEITLWIIDIDTGEYSEEFKGSLIETVDFFSE